MAEPTHFLPLRQAWKQERSRREHTLEQVIHLDLRLLAAALALFITTYGGFATGWCPTYLNLLCTALALGTFTAFILYLLNQKAAAGLLITCLLITGIQYTQLHQRGYTETSQLLTQLEGQPLRATGKISRTKKISAKTQLVEITLTQMRKNTGSLPAQRTISVFLSNTPAYPKNTPVEIVGTLQIQGPRISLKHPTMTPQHTVKPSKVAEYKEKLATDLAYAIGTDPAALTLGLTYGDDSLLSESSKENFQTTGLTHLTAVSGSNITLIFLICYRTGNYFNLSRGTLLITATIGTLAYATAVGWEGSVIRAWSMGTLAALAMILGHGKHITALLSSCIVLLLITSPELSYNLGFILSSLATAGLILLAPPLSRTISTFMPTLCADLISIPLAASLFTLPALIPLQEKIGTYTVAANICATPLVPLLTIIGILLTASYTLSLNPALDVLAKTAEIPARLLLHIADTFAQLPASTIAVSNPSYAILASLALILLTSSAVITIDYHLCGKTPQATTPRKVNL